MLTSSAVSQVLTSQGDFDQPSVSTNKSRVLKPIKLCNLNRIEPALMVDAFRCRSFGALNFECRGFHVAIVVGWVIARENTTQQICRCAGSKPKTKDSRSFVYSTFKATFIEHADRRTSASPTLCAAHPINYSTFFRNTVRGIR